MLAFDDDVLFVGVEVGEAGGVGYEHDVLVSGSGEADEVLHLAVGDDHEWMGAFRALGFV